MFIRVNKCAYIKVRIFQCIASLSVVYISSVGLEILEDIPDVDVIVAPCGGGGLLSGVGAVLRHRTPEGKCRLYGVEPDGGRYFQHAHPECI